jgi:hypothetical protein
LQPIIGAAAVAKGRLRAVMSGRQAATAPNLTCRSTQKVNP